MNKAVIIRYLGRSAAALCALIHIGTAHAQSTLLPAPTLLTMSPTGVDLGTGGFVWQDPGVSIGGADGFGFTVSLRNGSGTTYPLVQSNWNINFSSQIYSDPSIPSSYWPVLATVSFANSAESYWKPRRTVCCGDYYTNLPEGGALLYSGSASAPGGWVYTSKNGTVVTFPTSSSTVTTWARADGVVDTITPYASLTWIVDNRGYALIEEGATGSTPATKVCLVNLAITYLTPGSTCPNTAAAISFGYTSGQLTSYTAADGGTYTFQYDSNSNLACFKEPGSTACKVNNTYTACLNNGTTPSGYSYRVTSQTLADGTSYAYSYNPTYCHVTTNPPNPPDPSSQTTMTDPASGTTTAHFYGGQPTSIIDPLGRTTTIGMGYLAEYGYSWLADSKTNPEGDVVQFGYDGRGNITSATRKAKPGSGLSDLVTSAAYPSSCTTRNTCNKPTSVTDANGNTTSYTYSDTHGGVLTETGPAVAVNGGGTVAPVKRYAYVQRYAWIANGSGGFIHGSGQIWLLATMKTCRSTATNVTTDSCAGGSSDEVVTTYDYGPDTGLVGNNLWLRGQTVTADGQTLRTCYGYDTQGNRIWETKPRAGMSACY